MAEKIYGGEYILGEKLGQGGFAEVYKASARSLHHDVAIKIGLVDYRGGVEAELIRKEARIVHELNNGNYGKGHHNIVKRYLIPNPKQGGSGLDSANVTERRGTPPFFVMEYLSGGTLQAYLDIVDKIPQAEAASIGLQIARALNYMNKYQPNRVYYHNDLKLENIVFRHPLKAGRVAEPVLIDYGTATDEKRVLEKFITYYIAAPEQLQNRPDFAGAVDLNYRFEPSKVDIWQLGIVLYYMLAGQQPFKGKPGAITQRIIKEEPKDLEKVCKVDPKLARLIMKGCLAKNPDHRPSIPRDIGPLLKSLGDNVPVKTLSKQRSWFRR